MDSRDNKLRETNLKKEVNEKANDFIFSSEECQEMGKASRVIVSEEKIPKLEMKEILFHFPVNIDKNTLHNKGNQPTLPSNLILDNQVISQIQNDSGSKTDDCENLNKKKSSVSTKLKSTKDRISIRNENEEIDIKKHSLKEMDNRDVVRNDLEEEN